MNYKLLVPIGIALLSLTVFWRQSESKIQKILTYEESIENLGHKKIYKETEQREETTLISPEKTIFEDQRLYEKFLNRIRKFSKEDAEDVIITCSQGNKKDFYKMTFWNVGVVGPKGSQSIILDRRDDDCFETVVLDYVKLSESHVQLTFHPQNPRSQGCKDFYSIGSAMNFHPIVLGKKQHKVSFKNLSTDEMENIEMFGIHISRECDQFSRLLPDLSMTALLFFGGLGNKKYIPIFGSRPTLWQEKLNKKFIKKATGYELKKRQNKFIDLTDDEVNSGDFVAVDRLDGLDQMIQWGAGGRIGHSVLILKFQNETWAVESQGGWYWPQQGVQRTRWKDWKRLARNAGFEVAVLPMKQQVRAKFNVTAASDWFKTLEGLPYGYHTFIYGWIDTPDKNMPPPINLDFLFVLIARLDQMIPEGINSVFGEGLNLRLNTTGLRIAQIATEIGQRNITIGQLMAMKEMDGWRYSDGFSYQCSGLVAGMYKAGGLFEGLNVQGLQFTPRDIYQLAFFDKNYQVPEKCKQVDPEFPYCQIMGKVQLDFLSDRYSSVEPYYQMNQRCPSEAPLYERLEGC